ncbi:MAG TPA: S41 family peptidase [Clostridiaceae bacterium]
MGTIFKKNGKVEGKSLKLMIGTNLIAFILGIVATILILNGRIDTTNTISKLSKTLTVRHSIEKYYMGKIDITAIDEAAAKAEVAVLKDPYSVYMDKTEYKSYKEQESGSFVGIGLQIDQKVDAVIVAGTIDGSPAQKAGILQGDTILKVDGKEVTFTTAANMIRGLENTSVVLTLKRGDITLDVKIVRTKIITNPITTEVLESDIGYLKFPEFDTDSSIRFNEKLKDLQKQNIKGLILDVRGNPGGFLDQCVYITSNFIPKGKLIVSMKDKNNKETKYNSVGGTAIGLPLVVLTNAGSASASEVFSGAIKDYKAGTLVGEKTFGKGIVQSILDSYLEGFSDGSALKVTIAKYYSPKGYNIHGIGIVPDIAVEYPASLKLLPYAEKNDPQLNKALEVIKSKIK